MGNCCSSSSSSSEPDIQLGTSHENQKQQQVMSNAPQDTSQLFVESRNGNLHFKGWPESPVLRFASFNAP